MPDQLFFATDAGDAYGAGAAINELYPDIEWCTYVTCSDSSAIPPWKKRFRSRHRHDAGSANYACQWVSGPKGLQGFRYYNQLYITHIDFDVRVDAGHHVMATWDSRTLHFESWVDGGRWLRYTCEEWYAVSFDEYGIPSWRVLNWTWSTPYPCSEAEARTNAFLHDPASGWKRLAWGSRVSLKNLKPFTTLPERGTNLLPDLVDTQSVPNISAYLNEAHVRAYQSMPAITTNNIANLQQLFQLLKGIVQAVRGRSLALGSAKDIWLGYRYSYETTKADINELALYCDRMRNLSGRENITGHGYYEEYIGGDRFQFRCSLQAHMDDVIGIKSFAESVGLVLDGYNTWDLIPYSFIVDWFLHIGDMLETARDRNYAARLTPSVTWYSITHDYDLQDGTHICDYYRWHGANDMVDAMLPASILNHKSSSGETWVKRATDALCLI